MMQNKPNKLLFVLLLLITVSPLLAQTDTPLQWQTLVRPKYLVQLPASWTIDTSGKVGNAEMVALSPVTDTTDMFRENVNVLFSDLEESISAEDMEDFFEETVTEIKLGIKDVEIEMNVGEQKQGYYLRKLMYTASSNTLKFRFTQYFYLSGKDLMVVTFTSEAKSYNAYKEIGQKILESVRLIKQ
ncbi:MAG: hypothetical protein GXC72_11020 [Chitinophagaceae bacterium]|nr:hypothetical protein [Chitinophagaceae bacterium]